MKTITIEEVLEKKAEEAVIVDIRPEESFRSGSLEGAVNIPREEIEERQNELDRGKPVYVLCHTGDRSRDAAEELEEAGFDAYSIEGGYRAYLRILLSGLVSQNEQLEQKQSDIERSIIKKFRKPVWRQFTRAIREYELIRDGDKIAVCISGGKDSMLMAKLFQELHKHGRANFDLVFLVMNPGYNADNWKIIQDNARVLGIPLTVFETQIFDTVAGD